MRFEGEFEGVVREETHENMTKSFGLEWSAQKTRIQFCGITLVANTKQKIYERVHIYISESYIPVRS